MGSCCFSGVTKSLTSNVGNTVSRSQSPSEELYNGYRFDDDTFNELIVWLQKVPLLRVQLPKAEFPLIAAAVRKERYVYQPSEDIVLDGDNELIFPSASGGNRVRAALKNDFDDDAQDFKKCYSRRVAATKLVDQFAIIFVLSGTAIVHMNGEIHAELQEYDFWLSSLLQNHVKAGDDGPSVKAGSDGPLEIFVLWSNQFHELGLDRKLSFRKRIAGADAIHTMHDAIRSSFDSGDMNPLSVSEKEFLMQKLNENKILQDSIHTEYHGLYSKLAKVAVKVTLQPGTTIATENEFSQNLFVVFKGSLEVEIQEAGTNSPSSSLTREINSLARTIGQKTKHVQNKVRDRLPSQVGPGGMIGELSLLYDTNYLATYRVSEGQEAEVFIIGRVAFGRVFYKQPEDFQQRRELLHQVKQLSSCFSAEVARLARDAYGFHTFPAGQVALTQGKKRERPQWYIIDSGSAVLSKVLEAGQRPAEAVLRRGDTFGERSILWEQLGGVSEFTITAGPSGMTCLCIDGQILKHLNQTTQIVDPDALTRDAEVWMENKKQASHHRTSLNADLAIVPPLRTITFLGKGAFGAVFLQEDAVKKRFALKRMSKGVVVDSGAQEEVCTERLVTSLAHSPFVIRFFSCNVDDKFLYLTLEALEGGDLEHMMKEHEHIFDNSAVQFYAACISEGLGHLHTLRIIHRDVKPANIIVDHRGYAKLCDLGLARFVLDKARTFCGTLEYMAPEIVGSGLYSFEVDWWALGVLVFELFHQGRQTPFDQQADRARYNAEIGRPMLLQAQQLGVRHRMCQLPQASRAAEDIIEKLLICNPACRLGANGINEVRAHPWFGDCSFEELARVAAGPRAGVAGAANAWVPYTPGNLTMNGPPPDLYDDYILQGHCDCELKGNRIYDEHMTLEKAKERLQREDGLEGFNVRHDGPLDSSATLRIVFIGWIDIQQGENGIVGSNGWSAYVRKHVPYADYTAGGADADWDERFRPPRELLDRSTSMPACINVRPMSINFNAEQYPELAKQTSQTSA